jgi:nucleotide-binding universal stress UspA family protein
LNFVTASSREAHVKVLYATDGFKPALQASQLLQRICAKDRIEITVMSVTHTGIPAPEHMPLMLDPLPSRREDTLAIVDAAVEKLLAAGFKARGHTAEGHPGQEIVRAVEEDRYDLIVMGGGRRSWLGSRLLGSVSTYVLHSSPWSVLIVHETLSEGGEGRVLVGADGSRGSDFTIGTLVRFADPTRTKITVVSVVSPHSPLLFPDPGGAVYIPPEALEQNQEIEKQMRNRAQSHAERAATQLRDGGFEVEAHIATGSPTEQLLKGAESGDFDLIAVGSRGLGPFRRALLGSVSDHVVRHSRAALVGRRLAS